MQAMRFLSRLYRRLPVLRELSRILDETIAVRKTADKLALQQAHAFHAALKAEPRFQDPKRLNRHEHQVFSQNGEDGILAEIFRRIGAASSVFVEIGVGWWLENNTSFLLWHGWTGFWVEGDRGAVEELERSAREPLEAGRLKLLCGHVTKENVSGLLGGLGVPEEFDLLSLDIDRNTYWVWSALAAYKPRVVVIEYNATLPPDMDWKVEYRAELGWNDTHYFGASLKALERLGDKLGYALVGCDLSGTNAFFVRKELCDDKFAAPFTAENHYEPCRYFLARREGHPLCLSDLPPRAPAGSAPPP